MRFHLSRPSPALAVSCLALVVAFGGTGYAAFGIPKNSVGAKQLKKGAVTTTKIKNSAVTASKINTGGLTVPNATHAGSAPPSGPAGGALTGTYPNPGIGAGAISESNIAPHTIGASALGTITVKSAQTTGIANTLSGGASVQCPAGDQVLSGGFLTAAVSGVYVYLNEFDSPNGWKAGVLNASGAPASLTVQADCLAP